jgi:hypothetical protein
VSYSPSTSSSSSEHFTPDTDEQTDVDTYNTPHTDILAAPKIEELDINSPDDLKDIEPLPSVAAPRKRGRPRKPPFIGPQKPSHARSKTGCGTCRRRKKKCDETKPFCANCEKNNYVCSGYEPKQLWCGGRQKLYTTASQDMPPLPAVNGLNGSVDHHFLQYFTSRLGFRLSLTDNYNPFFEIIYCRAMQHVGLLHSVLYLSGSCLNATTKEPNPAWEDCQTHHGSQAFKILFEDLDKVAAAVPATIEEQNKPSTLQVYGDSSIAQALILCLQTVCAGDLTGAYRVHHLPLSPSNPD